MARTMLGAAQPFFQDTYLVSLGEAMATPGLDRAQARRVFEETLAKVQRQYALTEEGIVDVQAHDATGQMVMVARYKLCVDGRIECCQILDEVLWPNP